MELGAAARRSLGVAASERIRFDRSMACPYRPSVDEAYGCGIDLRGELADVDLPMFDLSTPTMAPASIRRQSNSRGCASQE
jgi:hypothetical protein